MPSFSCELLYCLHTLWLDQAELRKLNSFQAKSKKEASKIPHSCISRVANESVLKQCDCRRLSYTLTQRQLVLLGCIAHLPDDSIYCFGHICHFKRAVKPVELFGGKG
ncbi:unnamed protein product [Polarella glacialis]|uniref:Uncharacterized protein n=1 Tax=Polarella glacialis TaxID=89957 RepID=A0A813G491_POLGL|nr:unnamed protein product [Polarella glacialis]CAE8627221.1 unnamed protein product [Polarella glacialis]